MLITNISGHLFISEMKGYMTCCTSECPTNNDWGWGLKHCRHLENCHIGLKARFFFQCMCGGIEGHVAYNFLLFVTNNKEEMIEVIGVFRKFSCHSRNFINQQKC